MKLSEALALSALEPLHPVAAHQATGREVKWASSIDLPEPFEWIREGTLLMSTGYAWPREDHALIEYVRRIFEAGAAALVLSIPKYFPHFPEAARQEAERLGLPAFELAWELPFYPIIEQIHRHVLSEQSLLLERSEAIHRQLTEAALDARSLADLARTLHPLIGRRVRLDGEGGRLLAAEPPQTFETPTPAALEKRGLGHHLRTGRGAQHIEPGRMACPIRIGGEWVGTAWLEEGQSPFSELDARALEHAAVVSALHLTHQQALSMQEARLGYAFVDALLEGQFEPSPHALERSRLLGFDPEGRYQVALLRLEAGTPLSAQDFARREHLLETVRKRLEDLHIPALFSVTLAHIPLILPETLNGKPLPLERLWQELCSRFPHPLSLALARVEQGGAGVARSYREAQSLIRHVPPGQMRSHAELLLPRVLAGDASAQQDFLEGLFAPLRLERGGEALIQTLLAVTRSGFHLKKSAGVLGIHLNTLRYRLEKIHDLTGMALEDAETRFRLHLAAKLLELHEK